MAQGRLTYHGARVMKFWRIEPINRSAFASQLWRNWPITHPQRTITDKNSS
jgi:hypothetical protein